MKICPGCGGTNVMHGGYDRDDQGHLADTRQCRACDHVWNTRAKRCDCHRCDDYARPALPPR